MFQIDGVVYNAKELFGRCEACFPGGTLALGFIRGGSEIAPQSSIHIPIGMIPFQQFTFVCDNVFGISSAIRRLSAFWYIMEDIAPLNCLKITSRNSDSPNMSHPSKPLSWLCAGCSEGESFLPWYNSKHERPTCGRALFATYGRIPS